MSSQDSNLQSCWLDHVSCTEETAFAEDSSRLVWAKVQESHSARLVATWHGFNSCGRARASHFKLKGAQAAVPQAIHRHHYSTLLVSQQQNLLALQLCWASTAGDLPDSTGPSRHAWQKWTVALHKGDCRADQPSWCGMSRGAKEGASSQAHQNRSGVFMLVARLMCSVAMIAVQPARGQQYCSCRSPHLLSTCK